MSETKSEKEKMIAAELYNANDPELVQDRHNVKVKLLELNTKHVGGSKESLELARTVVDNPSKTAYIEPPFYCDYGYNIHIDEDFYCNFGCVILDGAPVKIGKKVFLAPNVQIYTATHPLDIQRRCIENIEYSKPISIGDYVWIGGNATICPGVTIGNGSVVGAGSVVTKDVPENVVVAGNPAKVIRKIDQGDFKHPSK